MNSSTNALSVFASTLQGGRRSSGNDQEDEEAEQKRIEEEMGLNAAQEKPEDEVLQRLVDSGIVASTTFIGSFAPAVVEIVLNKDGAFCPSGGADAQAANDRLRETAVLCLCKMMCISRSFCTAHLQVIFTVLARSPLPSVRSNVVRVDEKTVFELLLWWLQMLCCLPWSLSIPSALMLEHGSLFVCCFVFALCLSHVDPNRLLRWETWPSDSRWSLTHGRSICTLASEMTTSPCARTP